MARTAAPGVKLALKLHAEEAAGHGMLGAPSWRGPEGDLLWVNDGVEEALDGALKW